MKTSLAVLGLLVSVFTQVLWSQAVRITSDGRVGLGAIPDSSAILDLESTSQGVIFPRMTTAERNAIANPVNGLHIFNTDVQCLEYFDALIDAWNCYCTECRSRVFTIESSTCGIDFFIDYAGSSLIPQAYIVLIPESVVVSGCLSGTAIDFSGLPDGSSVSIVNYGSIVGAGGDGGDGSYGTHCLGPESMYPEDGMDGGDAIATVAGVVISIDNYGLIAGGGGGGGGGVSSGCDAVGGGGGGGAGNPAGGGGYGYFEYLGIEDGCSCYSYGAEDGTSGSLVTDQDSGNTGGEGGDGKIFTGDCSTNSFIVGAIGGNGGSLAMPGDASVLSSCNGFTSGGSPGKAIAGGSGNNIENLGDGLYYGVVD
jgi:hypothetical protein